MVSPTSVPPTFIDATVLFADGVPVMRPTTWKP
jgi:hypothetical protein